MKFLIQTEDEKPIHDFTRELVESCKYNTWLSNSFQYTIDIIDWGTGDNQFDFDDEDKDFIPIGSVEFVTAFLKRFHNLEPKPWNIPESLLSEKFTKRKVINGTKEDVKGHKFVKSNDKIKGFTELKDFGLKNKLPEGNYQISDEINIDSEYRCFIYRGELVGLKHYSGDFTLFPDMGQIFAMIKEFKDAPIAYTLDVGINNEFPPKSETFVIEVHDFFSCGLYGFNDYRILLHMFAKWFYEYIGLMKKV